MKTFQLLGMHFAVVFLCAMLGSSAALNAAAQTIQLDAQSQKVKDKIVKIGRGGDLTIKTKSGREFYGSVRNIEAEYVYINEVDLKQELEFKYTEIRAVEKGYGDKRAWNGTRIPKKKNRIGLVIATAAIAIPVMIVVVAMKD